MSLKTRNAAAGAAAIASLAALSLLLSARGNSGPRAWDLSLTLQVEGSYRVTVRGAAYDGDYAFTLDWQGTMEEDDDDYRLFQKDIRLLDWRARETAVVSGGRTLRTTADFTAAPSFHHLYVLKEKGVFHIDFALSGLPVPVHNGREKARLDLPRTTDSTAPKSKTAYDAHVLRGSNVIRLPAAWISDQPLERTFAWTWGHGKKPLPGGRAGRLSNSHTAGVSVRIRPVGTERS
ncbi:MAG: hypothetical protein JW747_01030 [Candidatus Aminicenantes bacterium]|nr:hypothetical protein [Candidatus Aminicenantes bacterium]